MNGSCLCGAIEVTTESQGEISLCHCTTCRRWSGGPMFAVHCGSSVQFNSSKPVAFRSSDWAERGFCGTCGTHLFHHLLPSDEYILPAGLFQDIDFNFTTEIFIDHKPSFYALSNETRKMTGKEVFSQFAG